MNLKLELGVLAASAVAGWNIALWIAINNPQMVTNMVMLLFVLMAMVMRVAIDMALPAVAYTIMACWSHLLSAPLCPFFLYFVACVAWNGYRLYTNGLKSSLGTSLSVAALASAYFAIAAFPTEFIEPGTVSGQMILAGALLAPFVLVLLVALRLIVELPILSVRYMGLVCDPGLHADFMTRCGLESALQSVS